MRAEVPVLGIKLPAAAVLGVASTDERWPGFAA